METILKVIILGVVISCLLASIILDVIGLIKYLRKEKEEEKDGK